MPRIKLNPFSGYRFRTEISVRTTDLNYGGHLGNDRLISLVHEARVAFLSDHGFTEIDCGGVSLIMADMAVNYLGEAFAGDLLQFEVGCGEPARSGFRMFFRITRLPDGDPIALVETGMACFDYDQRRLQPLPPRLRSICS